MKRFLWIFLAVSLFSLVWVGNVFAQKPTPSDDEVNAVASQMFCPVCENTPLDVCPTQACAQWRELIRTKLSEGWNADQIKQYFATQYGVRVLAEPPRQGLNWLVYIVPPFLIVIGVYILFRAFRSMHTVNQLAGGETEPNGPATDEYTSRIEEELKKRN